jgi:hypothetical protein
MLVVSLDPFAAICPLSLRGTRVELPVLLSSH